MNTEPFRRLFRAYGGHDCFKGCAWDKDTCRPGAGGFHGIGSLILWFGVGVPGVGGVSFELHTPMYPQTVIERGSNLPTYHPVGVVDLHYGEPPEYLTEWSTPQDCILIDGKCWRDCTYTAAEAGYDALLRGGEEGVWTWLAESYLPGVMRKD